MRSIKIKLILVFTTLILVLTIGLGTISISVVSKNLIKGAHGDLTTMAQSEAKYIQARITAELSYIDGLAQNPMVLDKTISQKDKAAFFEKEAKRTGYMSFAIVDKNGNSKGLDSEGAESSISDRDYFQKAIKGELAASDVLISKANGQMVNIFATPIKSNGEIVGVFYGRKTATVLSEVVSEFQYGATGYAYVINNQGVNVGHKDTELVMKQDNAIENAKQNKALKPLAELMQDKMLKREVGSGDYTYEGKNKMVGFAPVDGSPWIVVTGAETSEILQEVNALKYILVLFVIAAALSGMVLTYFISDSLAKPIVMITTVIHKFSAYDFSIDNNKLNKYLSRKDEIGKISNALVLMQKNIVSLIEHISKSSESVASSSEQLTATTEQSAATTDEVARTIEEIAHGANEQAKDMEQALGNMTELGLLIEQDQNYLVELNHSINQVTQLKDEGIKNIQVLPLHHF